MARKAPTSVIIIGSGIIGLASAHYLLKEGVQVTVIDSSEIAGACSKKNNGHILPSLVLPINSATALKRAALSIFDSRSPLKVKPRLSPSFISWASAFIGHCNRSAETRAAKALKPLLDLSYTSYIDLFDELKTDLEWRDNGLVYVFKREDSYQDFWFEARKLEDQFGIKPQALCGEALNEFDSGFSPNLAGGILYDVDGCLAPDKLTARWSKYLRSHGVNFIEHCEYKRSIVQDHCISEIQTESGTLTADAFIFAIGAHSRSIGREFGCKIPVEPGKGYSVTMARPNDSPNVAFVAPDESVAFTPYETEIRLGSMMEFIGFDASIPAARIEQIKKRIKPYLKNTSLEDAGEEWYGWRPVTPDSLPIIGPIPELQNGYIATGHQMIGVMSATGTGKLIADQVMNKPTCVPDVPFSANRFNR